MTPSQERTLRSDVADILSTLGVDTPSILETINADDVIRRVAEIFKLRLHPTSWSDKEIESAVRIHLQEMKDALRGMADEKKAGGWLEPGVAKSPSMLSAFVKVLVKNQRWDGADARVLQMSVLSTLESAGDPRRGGHTYGLVVGRVQSGKTTHYIGLIMAAIDAGYKQILVLGGHTNSLRAQCQRRLRGAIQSLTNEGIAFTMPEFVTSDQEDGDLSPRTAVSQVSDRPQIFVCKKNTSPLSVFAKKMLDSPLPLMIVDDEADWGTQNVSGDPEQEQTTINNLIVGIVDRVGASKHRAYVAYTATPYANLLVSESDAGAINIQYIKVILPGCGYLGNDEIVGDNDPLPVFVERKRTDTKRGGTTDQEDIEDAVSHFIISAAAYRAISQSHGETRRAKMLVNDSSLNLPQESLARRIGDVLRVVTRDILMGKLELMNTLKDKWQTDYVVNWAAFHNRIDGISAIPPDWNDLAKQIVEVANVLRPPKNGQGHVRIINSENDAWTAAEAADRMTEMIYVGGLVFARGVTIDNLATVLFAAPPNQQDTLMQYARWLGYRGNYTPLLRVILPDHDRAAYVEIAGLDRKLFEFLHRACDAQITPAQARVVVPIDSSGIITRPTSVAKTRLAAMTLEAKMLEPAVWEPSLVTSESVDLWNDAAIELLSNANEVEKTKTSYIYAVGEAAMLEYLRRVGGQGGRMGDLANAMYRRDGDLEWRIAIPIKKSSNKLDGGIVEHMYQMLNKNMPRIAVRAVNDPKRMRREGGGFANEADRSLDYVTRKTDDASALMAIKALEKALDMHGSSCWEGGTRPQVEGAGLTIENVRQEILSHVMPEQRPAAEKKTWARWLRRPGEAYCIIQVFELTHEKMDPLRIVLPAAVTPRSAEGIYGMVPRERGDD